jgi:hypothetical protein
MSMLNSRFDVQLLTDAAAGADHRLLRLIIDQYIIDSV